MDDPTRRNILKAGAAAAVMAAMPRVLAQQEGNDGTGTFYERGPVRIRCEEAGAGFPLMPHPDSGPAGRFPGPPLRRRQIHSFLKAHRPT